MSNQSVNPPKDYAPELTLVAVYGSLKKGFHNHPLLSDSACLGEGHTEPKFSMLHLGGFPGLVDGNRSIAVEVYAVNERTMRSLDYLEGYPSFYTRTLEKIVLEDGAVVEAWIYQLASPRSYDSREEYVHEVAGHIHWSRIHF